MLTMTEKAAKEVKRLKEKQGVPEETGLRIGVKGGGCSGFTYVMRFEEDPAPHDKVLDFHGVRIFVDPKSATYLEETEVDFRDGLLKRGFTYNNPKAESSCSCGESFGM